MKDEFGDRMKLYEPANDGRQLMPLLPIIARLDGKCFSSFTCGLERLYDQRLSDLMVDTTAYLVREANAACGYIQSDEITLGWWSPDFARQVYSLVERASRSTVNYRKRTRASTTGGGGPWNDASS